MAKQKVDEKYIINQSIKLFRQKTYHNTSMADIAEACGILKGSLYHYFRSKEELMEKVIASVHLYFKDEIFAIAYNKDIEPQKRLEKLAKASEKVFFDEKTGSLYGNMGVESAMVIETFNPILREFFNDFFEALKNIYIEKYPDNIANELAERSVAEMEGSIMMARIFNDVAFIRNTHKRLINRMEK